MDDISPDKKYRPYAAIALSLLGLVLLSLLGMFLLIASTITIPGDGATPWLREKTWVIKGLVISTPLMLVSATGFAIAGIRAGHTVLANQVICGWCFLVMCLMVSLYF